MPYGTVNADVITTSTAGGVLGAGNASIMKNRLINGNFAISQYNGTSSVTPTATSYIIDRWKTSISQSSKLSFQQNAGSVATPAGFSNYLGATSLSAYSVGSSDYFTIQQAIEGFNTSDLNWGTANAKTVTLSFQVYSSLTGTFGGSIANSSFNYAYPFTYTISAANTWTTISVTIAGPTSGTWTGATNAVGLFVYFGLGVGSTLAGTAGSWQSGNLVSATGATSVVGTNGATFYITGVQLEVGSSATGFEYVNYQTSLANCQRYYQKLTYIANACMSMGCATSTTAAQCGLNLLQQMRASPTITVPTCGNGLNQITFLTGSGNYPSGFGTNTAASIGTTSFTVTGSGYTGFTAGQAAIFYASDGTPTFTASAEL